MAAAGVLTASLVLSTFLLHSVLRRKNLNFEEFQGTDMVFIEAPPLSTAGFENDMRRLYNNVSRLGPKVALAVQPSLRQRNTKSLWVNRWNYTTGSSEAEGGLFPKFIRTCSCKLGNPVPGLHLTYYIAKNYGRVCEPCSEVPTLEATDEANETCLGGVADYLCQALDPLRDRKPDSYGVHMCVYLC